MGVKLKEDVAGVLLGELRRGREWERGLCKCTGCGCPIDIEGSSRDMGTSEHGVRIKEERKKEKERAERRLDQDAGKTNISTVDRDSR